MDSEAGNGCGVATANVDKYRCYKHIQQKEVQRQQRKYLFNSSTYRRNLVTILYLLVTIKLTIPRDTDSWALVIFEIRVKNEYNKFKRYITTKSIPKSYFKVKIY